MIASAPLRQINESGGGWTPIAAGVNAASFGLRPTASPEANNAAWDTIARYFAGRGGLLFLEPGTYDKSTPFQGLANCVVAGAGVGSTVLRCVADIGSPNIFVNVGDKGTLRDLSVDCNLQNTNGVACNAVDDTLVENVHVYNCVSYGCWSIDFDGQAARSGVQYGNHRWVNVICEARECFESFYTRGNQYVNCRAIGSSSIGGSGVATQNGWVHRDEASLIQLINCRTEGAFTSAFLKATNNDAATTFRGDIQARNCYFEGNATWGIYLLDLTHCDLNVHVKAGGATIGAFLGFTTAGHVESFRELSGRLETATGTPLRLAAGDGHDISCDLVTSGATHLLELGTATKETDRTTFRGRMFLASSVAASTFRPIKLNKGRYTAFEGASFLGDGVRYQLLQDSSGGASHGCSWRGCEFDGARINGIYGSGWLVDACRFRNDAGAPITAARYIGVDGANALSVKSCIAGDGIPLTIGTPNANSQVGPNVEY